MSSVFFHRSLLQCPARFMPWRMALLIAALSMASLSAENHTPMALPKQALKPGGIAIIKLPRVSALPPSVVYQGDQVLTVLNKNADPAEWLAIIGIPLKNSLGKQSVSITALDGTSKKVHFSVTHHPYKTQRLTIKDDNKVNPNAKSMQRIIREQGVKKSLLATHSAFIPDLDFIKPTAGRDSGRYGLRRIINRQSRNPHSGMDIAAPQGRTIKAASAGKVLHTGDWFFSGRVVLLDHGSGLITLYAHMDKIHVRKGQVMQKGEAIGTVGKTGRVTGAHLHWSVYLNGNAIDPALFL